MACTYTNGLLNAEQIIASMNEKEPLTGIAIHRSTETNKNHLCIFPFVNY